MKQVSTPQASEQSALAVLLQENEQLRREKMQMEETIRQQQVELRLIEQRWKLALAGVGDAIWELNLQTGEIYRSAQYRKVLGYSSEELPDIAQAWENLLHPLDRNSIPTQEMDRYQSGSWETHRVEYRLQSKDGSYKYFLDRGRLFSYSADGSPLMMIGITTDITAQKRTEETLRTNINRLSNLIADLQEGILLEDEHRSIVLVNPHFCELFAVPLTPDQLKGVDCSGMAEQSKHFFKDPDQFTNRVSQLLQKQEQVIGEELELADGRIFERDYIPIFTDDIYAGHLWKYTDITKRKHAEGVALHLTEKYQRIIENMNLGLIEVDLDERIVYTNQSFCGMSGYEPEELIGNIATDILLKGQNIQAMREKNESRLKGVMDAYEVEIKNKQGEDMWWLVSGAPLYSETGKVIGSTGIHLDITKQKQLESELRIAKQEAEHSSRAKEHFLANMSHEIRTPMNAILSLGQQLTKTSLTQQQQFFLSMINTAASNLLVIINDILDFSKIEAGQLALEHIGFNLADLLQRAVLVVAQNAHEKDLKLITSIDPGLEPVLMGDPYRLNQILLNLIGNSIKFTDYGTVQVHCNCQTIGNQQAIHITVTDTGIGMEPDFLQNLFTKFTQEDGTIGRRYGGTGLGMSITKQLVDLMGGKIHVESTKNVGTAIHIQLTFPIGTQNDLVTRESHIHNDDLLRAKQILLVEDNEMNRLVVRTILEPYGVSIVEVTNGLEAIETLRANSFDLILMDVQMPVMDGLEATRFIRRELSTSMPIIALTASAIRNEKEACYTAGMNDFLAKPFDENDLVEKLRKWLGCVDTVVDAKDKEMSKSMYNLTKLEAISRGDQEFTQNMIQLFCTDVLAAAAQIKTAYEAEDYTTVKSLAHRVKPSIDIMGLQAQFEEVYRIEELASTGTNSPELSELITRFEQGINAATAHMKATYLTTNQSD
ncbi:PAS domain S-box protein [Spirosoma sp. HMF3257]|uniref:Sensory/regulatory protein RpfC n=1 Tax=Spirosoma telluris TaxID=2183553 RepID=A0A327NUH1_9BACT|nr:PAS domain S-box protein [Spirosoma telluris]RAI78079.1 histidine kinase [Spirosoma telluris]